MKKRLLHSLFLMLFIASQALAQDRTVTGTVTDKSDGSSLPGVSVKVSGTQVGTQTGPDGKFAIRVPQGSSSLQFSYVGYTAVTISIPASNVLNVSLAADTKILNEVVVTSFGQNRTRNQLPYAAQQVSGAEASKSRSSNFVSSLSGKIAGLEIRQTNTLGGSTNIVLRGVKSITGNNQALFVVDGVPFDNSNTNTSDQRTGRGGYDYGSSVADINPDDIESITTLKGAAASALYGSRGSNGVILITTKKAKQGLGITVNSGISVGSIDKSTFPTYQTKYGGGYGKYYEDTSGHFLYRDPNTFAPLDQTTDPSGVLIAPLSEDASYGAAFDPNLQVYQWDAFDPASPNFHKARPWVAATNLPNTFFEKPISANNSILINGASDKGSFKVGYTRNDDKGVLPNSKITKNTINFGSSYNITQKLTAGASVNFSNVSGLGRYGTGYDNQNLAMNFRQWWQVNADIKELKDAYNRNGKNVTWNWADPTDIGVPIFWNNPYFTRYKDYENDTRNRYFGNVNLNYKITNYLNVLGRIAVDSYAEIQEERRALTSTANDGPPYYSRFNRGFNETNYDLLLNFDKNISSDFNLKALLGTNIRRQSITSIFATTNGGLVIPNNYSLQNSSSPLEAPVEQDLRKEVDGVFAGTTLSYKNFLTLDGTIRRDVSSTLPKGNNAYYYPSVSLGFVFSELMKNSTWLTYGKLRGNIAQVGADAPFYSTKDAYVIASPFGSAPLASVGSTRSNPNLLPEKTKSSEVGLEMEFFKNRLGFDATYYKAESFNQILPTTVSTATGYTSKFLNAGTILNKGIEISLKAVPVSTEDFSWTINVNWTRNRNKVQRLFEGSTNLLLANYQGGVSTNATLGQPYGTLRGSDFVYDSISGQKVVKANGRYLLSTTSNQVIGNPNPDWIAGINNSLKYKNVSLSWLVDMRQGGDVFSLDMYYGLATGLYPETAGLNDLGNPLRLPIAQGGGIIREGVTADGKPNTKRVETSNFGAYGYRYSPAKAFVYDASYVKLREVVLTYSLPATLLNRVAYLNTFKGIELNLIGRNLWIIHKNLPYSDPEETVSAGNFQGYQTGAYPTTRTFALNLKLRF